MHHRFNKYSSDSKLKFGVGKNFSLLCKNTMKELNLTMNAGHAAVNDKLKRGRAVHLC